MTLWNIRKKFFSKGIHSKEEEATDNVGRAHKKYLVESFEKYFNKDPLFIFMYFKKIND